MAKRTEKDIRENTAFAKSVIKHLFGTARAKFEYKPMGLTNFVFDVTAPAGSFIVRISRSPEKLKDFTKEQWAVARVKKLGVPVAEILEVGHDVIPFPYMVQKKIDGQEALYHPEKKKILHQIGEYTSVINSIKTSGFGKVFDWSQNTLSKNATWKQFLENELQLESRIQILDRNRIFSKIKLKALKRSLEQADAIGRRPVLNHGDMRRKNVMVDEKGKVIAIIDWEECCSNYALFWELSIALHDLSVDDKQSFLEGYGLTPKKYSKISGVIACLNIINYAPVIAKLVKRKELHTLQFYKLRLKGDFDLYTI